MSLLIGPLVPGVVLPRFTSYVGPGEYATAPMLVEDYDQGVVTFWRGPIVGGAAVDPFQAWIEESHDALFWTDVVAGPITLAAPPERFDLALTKRWMRVLVELKEDANDVVAVTLWMTGVLRRRIEES